MSTTTRREVDPRPRLLSASLDALRRLERFGVTALPARTSWELPGWLCLADDGGYVNRANSATPLPAEDAATVSEVAAGYRERGLPPLIRWTPEAPEATAAQLEAEGWRSRGEVLVMNRPLTTAGDGSDSGSKLVDGAEIDLSLEASAAWERSLSASFGDQEGAARLRLALDAPREKRFAELTIDGVVAGVGLALSRSGIVGLFDVMVEPQFRRRGLATSLVSALLDWGASTGAEQAFLQVAASNQAAVALYERAGFEVAYTYVYAGPEPDSEVGASEAGASEAGESDA